MKTIPTLLAAAAFALVGSVVPDEAEARIPYVWGEHVSHVADLPPHPELEIEGKAAKLGFEHHYVSIAKLPLWGSTEGNYVIYAEDGRRTQYHRLSVEQAQVLAAVAGIEFAGPQPFSKLSMIWGLAIFVPLAGAGVYGKATGRA